MAKQVCYIWHEMPKYLVLGKQIRCYGIVNETMDFECRVSSLYTTQTIPEGKKDKIWVIWG